MRCSRTQGPLSPPRRRRKLGGIAAAHESRCGPSVWTGRALQVENDDLEKLVLRFCIRPIDGAFQLLAIMDIRARSISFATRPPRPEGPPDHERAGETFSPSPLSDSQTSAGKPTITFGDQPKPSAISLVNLSEFISGCCFHDARFIAALLCQHSPGDPRQLVGECRG